MKSCLLLILLLATLPSAYGTPILEGATNGPTGVTGLDINGSQYDGTFGQTGPAVALPTNLIAPDAAGALASALNKLGVFGFDGLDSGLPLPTLRQGFSGLSDTLYIPNASDQYNVVAGVYGYIHLPLNPASPFYAAWSVPAATDPVANYGFSGAGSLSEQDGVSVKFALTRTVQEPPEIALIALGLACLGMFRCRFRQGSLRYLAARLVGAEQGALGIGALAVRTPCSVIWGMGTTRLPVRSSQKTPLG